MILLFCHSKFISVEMAENELIRAFYRKNLYLLLK